MEEKIDKKLKEYGISRTDLTDRQIKELEKEITNEEKGLVLIDGVLFDIPPYAKKQG